MSIDDGSAVAAVTYKIQGYISQHPRQNVTEQSEVTLGVLRNGSIGAVARDCDPPGMLKYTQFRSWRATVLQDEPSLRPEPQGEGRVNPLWPQPFRRSLPRIIKGGKSCFMS